jgi:hypothetical protein
LGRYGRGVSDVEMQSALLLAVPAAEAAAGPHRARLDASARDGVPAHITVLYPFLPPAEIGPHVLAGLYDGRYNGRLLGDPLCYHHLPTDTGHAPARRSL